MLVTLVPTLVACLHVTGALPLPVLDRLENLLYDTRLRATMPRSMDDRIVIVDIDEVSLDRIGQWPWGRDRMAQLVTELFERQQAAVVGFDVVFAEPDGTSGWRSLQELAAGPLAAQPAITAQIAALAPELDYDARFAAALQGRPAVLGYYLTSDRQGHAMGQLPAPALPGTQLRGPPLRATSWNGYGANIAELARAAPVAGFFNSVTDADGIVRAMPLLAEYQGHYYESLPLAMFRQVQGLTQVLPIYGTAEPPVGDVEVVAGLLLRGAAGALPVAVDERLATLVPFRGPGGPLGGSFRYISAADLIESRLPAQALQGRQVLVGTTAPGLLDLRATPVGRAYPGVEAHANVLSGFLSGQQMIRPDYAVGFDVLQVAVTGLVLALALPFLSATWAVVVSGAMAFSLVALNAWLYLAHGLALPLATALLTTVLALALNMMYGYFVESRAKRGLAQLFGTYVPPELVEEMVRQPEQYSMQAEHRELTVMFCDMRGFTTLSEGLQPLQLQQLLNDVFSVLTGIIRTRRGTIDKYMGDCIMAFWGAPVPTQEHAHLAVDAALAMQAAMEEINARHRQQGLPDVGIGIGLNTGVMCVGDMGSDIRRSYTVIGDAVNLASRLEGLSKVYGVGIVASAATRQQAPAYVWQPLDRVQVKGKAEAVDISTPLEYLASPHAAEHAERAERWQQLLTTYQTGEWAQCADVLHSINAIQPESALVALYRQRLEAARAQQPGDRWSGVAVFEQK